MTSKDSTTKTCTKCGTRKPLYEYPPDKKAKNRLHSWCRYCKNLKAQIWRDNNKDKVAKYNEVNNKKYYKANGYPTNKRTTTRNRLTSAVQRGAIEKPLLCEGCYSDGNGRIEGHHEDYAKPLDVLWLCAGCHGFIHRIEATKLELKQYRNSI